MAEVVMAVAVVVVAAAPGFPLAARLTVAQRGLLAWFTRLQAWPTRLLA